VSPRKRDTRYPHAFSKGQGVRFTPQGSWRPQAPCIIQTQGLGTAMSRERDTAPEQPPSDSAPRAQAAEGGSAKGMQRSGNADNALKQPPGDSAKRMQRSVSANPALKQRSVSANREKYLKVCPTIADLYRNHFGVAVICADCLHGVGHRNPGLPDRYRRQWGLTLLELERKYRCEMCGARNARVYPWWGDSGGVTGIQAAVGEGR